MRSGAELQFPQISACAEWGGFGKLAAFRSVGKVAEWPLNGGATDYPHGNKREAEMATSSITTNFYCDNAKATNTFVDLLLSEKPPEKWVVPVPTGSVPEFKKRRDVSNFVKRVVRARRRPQIGGNSRDGLFVVLELPTHRQPRNAPSHSQGLRRDGLPLSRDLHPV